MRFFLKNLPAPLVWIVVSALAFAGGILLFDLVVLPTLVHRGMDVRAPDLAYMPVPQAEKVATRNGLLLRTRTEQFDSAVPRGSVLSQDPPAGVLTRRGRVIQVVVSLGEEKATLPPLRGQDFRAAQLTLGRFSLQPGPIARLYSDDVPREHVIASDPAPDSPIPENRPVSLLMSLGEPPRRFLVPNFVGTRMRDVVGVLDRAGIRYTLVGRDAAMVGVVNSQNPQPGGMIVTGETMELSAGHGR